MTAQRPYLVGYSKTGSDRLKTNSAALTRRACLRHLFIFLCSPYVAGCGSQVTDRLKSPPPDVSVVKTTNPGANRIPQLTGRADATASVALRPTVSGYIELVLFEEGSEVQAGDVLFVIDQRLHLTEIARADAELERIRAQAKETGREAAHARRLLEERAISQKEHDQRAAVDEQVRADLRAAEAAVETARLELELTEVRAPISGRVGRAFVTPGSLVIAGETVLATIVSITPIYV